MAGTSKERGLNATAASLLGLLHAEPLSGWDLVGRAQQCIGDFWTLTQSQVYRELAAMDGAGLIEKGEVGPRERTPYLITDAGRAAFAEWIGRDPGSDTIRVPMLLTLAFGEHLEPGRLYEILELTRRQHEDALAGYLASAELDLPPSQRATLDFGIGYERSVLAWFDRLPAILGLPADARALPGG